MEVVGDLEGEASRECMTVWDVRLLGSGRVGHDMVADDGGRIRVAGVKVDD